MEFVLFEVETTLEEHLITLLSFLYLPQLLNEVLRRPRT